MQKLGCIPYRVRTDCGTENVNLAALQTFLSRRINAHVYGSSPSNQRIEAWWSFLRRSRSQWWINLFEDLIDFDVFHVGNVYETDCLRFCFMPILRGDLQDVVRLWNTHRIRPSSGSVCPAGIPDLLYFNPRDPAVDCSVHLTTDLVLPDSLRDQVKPSTVCAVNHFGDYLHRICYVNNWNSPETVDEALRLYFRFLPYIGQF